MRLLVTTTLICATAAVLGCADLKAYRTERVAAPYTSTNAPCAPSREDAATADAGGKVPDRCEARIREDAPNYRLYFTEFDDQGWIYPAGERYGNASAQLDTFVRDLRDVITGSTESISVVVFVHGWKHTARTDDTNVERFRSLLDSLNEVEQATGCRRHVIGLYVGWRGAATTLGEPIENLTFYNRKSAAERVALGDVRVLFSQLRAIQDMANSAWNEKIQKGRVFSASGAATSNAAALPVSHSQCQKRMRLSIAGHSFGGLIVYTSLAQALIRDVVDLQQAEELARLTGGPRPTLSREGDLVVVINPAIEATRFEPLLRTVQGHDLPHYHAPLFVAITSTDDQATRQFFPIGRSLGAVWENYAISADDREKRANLSTLGQDEDFLTHTLTARRYGEPRGAGTSSDGQPPCLGWNTPNAPFQDRLEIEARESATFLQRLERNGYDARGLFPRTFCSIDLLGLETSRRFGDAAMNSPIWNIRTSAPIVDNHNDFSNPRLIAFLRQLYREAEFKDEQVRQLAR
ncbi:MAG: hypothetical protein M3Z29_10935 [Pseudomonadota bacterium]|nr:hypothetical protein [Pseudomonadota bacterium]